MLVDENIIVSNSAMECISDLLKITNLNDISGLIQKFLKMASENDNENNKKALGVYALMSILLAFHNEIYSWTEEALKIVLKNKNLKPDSKKKVKAFCSKFWKNRTVTWNLESDSALSQTVIEDLREIANPYNYFS